MARLREIPEEVARQALVNKTINADQLREAAEGDPVEVDIDDLTLVATDVCAPELVPYEYAYTDVYSDGDRFFLAVNERYYRRSSSRSLAQA